MVWYVYTKYYVQSLVGDPCWIYSLRLNFSVSCVFFFLVLFNSLIKFQDLVVGYMGVPKYSGLSMTEHPQYITVRYYHSWQNTSNFTSQICMPDLRGAWLQNQYFVQNFSNYKSRNERGREMLKLVENLLDVTPTISSVRDNCSESHPKSWNFTHLLDRETWW